MNTRFKFRVRDNINKRYDTDLSLIDKDGDLCYQDGCKYCNGEHHEDFIIERCTGITDVKDCLIYEHDRVKTITGKVGVVKWLNGGFWVVFEDKTWCAVCGTQEVVGNIHEMENEVSNEE